MSQDKYPAGVLDVMDVEKLDTGSVIRSVNIDRETGQVVEHGARPLRRLQDGTWIVDATGEIYQPTQLVGTFVVEHRPWHPVDLDNPPDPCPYGCGCVWREDADRSECGCDGPCCSPTDDKGNPVFGPEWDQRPDPNDPPPKLARDAPLNLDTSMAEHWPASLGLTAGALRRALADVPDETYIILRKDSEGNGFSPLSEISEALYLPESNWDGQTYIRDEHIGELEFDDYGAPDGAFPVIELGPVN